MRKIKFRGFGISDKRWHYGFLIIYEGGKCIVGGFEVYPKSIGEYTGLKDKNNKEIYEGDILDTDLERPYLVVEFRNGCFVVECRDDNEKYYDIMHPLEKEISNLEYHEVIGNTYENPELLR